MKAIWVLLVPLLFLAACCDQDPVPCGCPVSGPSLDTDRGGEEILESPYNEFGHREVLCTTEITGPLATNGSHFFYWGVRPVPGGLVRVPVDGGAEEHVSKGGCEVPSSTSKLYRVRMVANESHVFWTGEGLCRAPVEGGDAEVLWDPPENPDVWDLVYDVVLDGDHLYFTEGGSIREMKLDGTFVKTLAEAPLVSHLALDGDRLWFMAGGGVGRLDLQTGDMGWVVKYGSPSGRELVLDDERLYWTSYGNEHGCNNSECFIWAAAKEVGEPDVVAVAAQPMWGLAAADGDVYWVGNGFMQERGPHPTAGVYRTNGETGETTLLAVGGTGNSLWGFLLGDEYVFLDPEGAWANQDPALNRNCILAVPRFPEDWTSSR